MSTLCKMQNPSPSLEIVCSPIEHIDATEITNSPTHSVISNSSTILAPEMDVEQTLTNLENPNSSSLFPPWIDMPTFSNLPATSNPNLEITMINEHFSSDPQNAQNQNSSNSTNLKSPHPRTPTLLDNNDNPPPKKNST